MDEIQRETIANQRFHLIAPVVKHLRENLVRGERYAFSFWFSNKSFKTSKTRFS